jgi:LCP family protein required for cell wall assembly
MQCPMSKDPEDRFGEEPPEYRVYRTRGRRPKAKTAAGRASRERTSQADSRDSADLAADEVGQGEDGQEDGWAPGVGQRPYRTYRSAPRGLLARLRAESDPELELARAAARKPRPPKGPWLRTWTWKRALKYVALAVVGWFALSFALFMISAGQSPALPAAALRELTPGGNMLTSANTVLILGTDQRPRTGPGSKEPGANYNVAGSNSDTIMLWRIGGGVSRRLSIPRDTVTNIPGYGEAKINAGFAIGGPALAVKTIKEFTGLQINHVIVVNLAAFPPFIDALGGIDVRTGRVCANISGGTRNGGFTLDLSPGVHHMSGLQALVYARVRENPCTPTDNDLTRELHQQAILNAIRSRLLSPSTFLRLPWASWQAPKVLETDMGGLTLMSLFIASEMGGSAPPTRLPTTGAVSPSLGDIRVASPSAVQAAVLQLMNG